MEEARRLREEGTAEVDAIMASTLSGIFDYEPNDRLPSDWRWLSFDELLANGKDGMRTGPFGTLLSKADIVQNGIPVLGIANVQPNKFVNGFKDYVSVQKAEALGQYELYSGDIVVARSGTVGRSCVIPDLITPAPIMSTNLIRIRLNEKVFVPKLLSRLFNKSRLVERHKDKYCRGSTRTFFTQKILKKLNVPVPPLERQEQIIAYLEQLQAKVDIVGGLQSTTQRELDALLPAILDKAFKGTL